MTKSDTLARVSAGTPKRTVRVEDDLWARYAALCEREGTSCAVDLRAHIERRVKEDAERPAQAATPNQD